MHSILYTVDGQIFKLGPFDNEDKAMEAAQKAQASDEDFDIRDQRVYILSPSHNMTELSMGDLGLS